jgi:hypothetical protein
LLKSGEAPIGVLAAPIGIVAGSVSLWRIRQGHGLDHGRRMAKAAIMIGVVAFALSLALVLSTQAT